MEKESDDSLFSVALVKQSFDQAQRSIRIIEAFSAVDIKIRNPEQEDEWFLSQGPLKDGNDKTIIKLTAMEDSSLKIFIEDEMNDQNFYIPAEGEDSI